MDFGAVLNGFADLMNNVALKTGLLFLIGMAWKKNPALFSKLIPRVLGAVSALIAALGPLADLLTQAQAQNQPVTLLTSMTTSEVLFRVAGATSAGRPWYMSFFADAVFPWAVSIAMVALGKHEGEAAVAGRMNIRTAAEWKAAKTAGRV